MEGGLRAILAYRIEGENLDKGELGEDNKLAGEGPYRVVVPQRVVSPPDQRLTAEDQNVLWPYEETWDHNSGTCSRTVTIIRVEPLPEGTTDLDVLEEGWNLVEQEKIIVYGAIGETFEEIPVGEDLVIDLPVVRYNSGPQKAITSLPREKRASPWTPK